MNAESRELLVPIRTGRGLNDRLTPFLAREKKRKIQEAIHLLWPWQWRQTKWETPLKVTMTRVKPSGKPLDDDNLAGSLKGAQDQIARELGVDDGDRAKISWERKEAFGEWGLRIEIGGHP